MEISLLAVGICAVLSMVVGAIWYGPLFGKKWMEIVGVKPEDIERRKEMQKSAGPLYVIQFLLTLMQVYILAYFVNAWTYAPAVRTALFIWLGFVMPTIAGSSMWTNDSRRIVWARFLIQSGYQLILFIIFGAVLSFWK